MRILFFSTYYHPYLSGLTTYPRKILKHLSNNHIITIATFHYSNRLSRHCKDGKMTVSRMPYLLKISKGFISPQSWIEYIKYTRATDLVILNIPNFEALPLAIIARICHKPVISIFHCRVDLGKSISNRVTTAILNMSVYLQLWLSKTIVIYTRDYFQHLNREKIFTHKTITILPAISQPEVNQQKLDSFLGQKKDYTWIGFSGRVSKEKGIHHLIEAIDILPDKTKTKLMIAGPYGQDVAGESHYYSYIKSLLETRKTNHQFLGTLTNGNLGAFYQAIDILILPSDNRTEAFGMVQVDAMLSGKPVIASNLPGVRIPVQLTGMGLLVEPGDQNGLSQAITEILKKPEKYSNAQLKNKASKIFADQIAYDSYDQLLADIADKPRKKEN